MNGAVLFGLLSALSWGAGDFCGGLATKRSSLFGVLIFAQIVGGILLAAIGLLAGEPLPPLQVLLLGGFAGLAGTLGLMSLYYALARGKMGVAAPISGVVATSLPVIFAAATEGLPNGLQLAGFVVALAGIWLVARSDAGDMRVADLWLPILAGLGFGAFYLIIDQVSATAIYWPLVAARVCSVVLLTAVGLLLRRPLLPAPGRLPLIALSGVFDAGGNTFFALASLAGRLDIASVLASLYPATTVMLAAIFLKERLSHPQRLGVAATLAAIVLIVL
jgi:drug/metabolite transporter (DMT)-like permease